MHEAEGGGEEEGAQVEGWRQTEKEKWWEAGLSPAQARKHKEKNTAIKPLYDYEY